MTKTTKDKNKIPFLSFFLSDPVKGAGTLVLIFLVEIPNKKKLQQKKNEMQTIPHFIFEKKSFTRLHLMKMRYHRFLFFVKSSFHLLPIGKMIFEDKILKKK
jgi:hypothetical protein